MARRAATAPPQLAGFDHVSAIGSGGYADVFLFEQHSPARQVAIKVLDPETMPAETGLAMFDSEANLMARVSTHPFIVQVLQTGVAADGRPYIVMEYYPGPNFNDRSRSEQLAVAEALRVGVQLASAVETAHAAKILHRDIKPANVLTSEYQRPGLTDFGIASAQGPGLDTAYGLSIPWAPPEALGDSVLDRRSDVYSLAATVYSLLAGRSPFEVRGGDNSQLALMGRIQHQPVPGTGRPDVPVSLERVLAHAMEKAPAHRPSTAAEFGRQLQGVELELALAVTELELAGSGRPTPTARCADDHDSTRIKGIDQIHAQGTPTVPAISEVPRDGGSMPADGAPRERERIGIPDEPAPADTIIRPEQRSPAELVAGIEQRSGAARWPMIVAGMEQRSGAARWPMIVAGVMVLAVAVGLVVAIAGRGDSPAAAQTSPFDEQEINDRIIQPVAVAPAPLDELVGVAGADGSFSFTWDDRGADVTYAVTPDGGPTEEVDRPTFETSAECIEVEVIGADDHVSAPTRGCAT